VTSRPCVLTINGGSSSIRFAVYQAGETLRPRLKGKIDRIGLTGTSLVANSPVEQPTAPRRLAVFGSKLRTDCSLTADWPTAAMPNVKHLHDVAFDSEQDAIEVRAATIQKVTHVNG
jgi:hypothetical protein